MSYSVILLNGEEGLQRQFLDLPKHIYGKHEIMQEEDTERAILTGTHTLSHYFQVLGLLAVDEQKRAIGRASITIYPDNTTAYLGFFECENCIEACRVLLNRAEELAREKGCKEIVGPVDASIWIRYRFKTNHFESSYTGEPYNKEYYTFLWEQCGYQVDQKYFSNHYKRIAPEFSNERYHSRLEEKESAGYSIVSPTKKTIGRTLNEVYDLLIELYRHFPAYTYVTKEEFIALYGYLEKLVRFNMVKMAYFEEKPVGFFVSIPNYQNIVYGKLTIADYLKIMRIHRNPRDYVMLYMGVDVSHKGLGKALAESIMEELKRAGTPSVGALIRKGNINKDYFSELIDYEYSYVLLKKVLEK